MIQQVLFLVIAGLAVAHLYKSFMVVGPVERFETVADNGPDGILDAQTADITVATEKDIFNRNPNRIANVSYKTPGNHGDPPMAPDNDDPRDLPWIATWTAADRAARGGQTCIPKHTEPGPSNTIIQTTSRTCEAGMPHTRPGGRIIIPDSILPTDRQEVLNHELIHVFQARDSDTWRQFYRRNWSFELFKEPPASLPADLRAAKRANPDTADFPWSCWKGRYWPMAVYTDPKHPTLRGAVTVWWDTWKSATLGPNDPPEGWITFFGPVAQDEHPNEIAAVMIATDDTSSEAGRRLRAWWTTQREFAAIRH